MGDPALNVPDGQTDAILALVNVWPISLTDCSHSPISSNVGINERTDGAVQPQQK